MDTASAALKVNNAMQRYSVVVLNYSRDLVRVVSNISDNKHSGDYMNVETLLVLLSKDSQTAL